MKKFILLSFTLVISVAFFTASTLAPQGITEVNAQVMQTESTITVAGTGKLKVQPDFATINLSVETKNRNIEDAQTENAEIVRNLVEVLVQHDIDEKDIKTTWYNIYPDHDHYGGRVLGHRVSNNLSVKVRDIKNVGKVIDATTTAGASTVSGVQFGIEESSNAYGEALAKAVESARQKATLISTISGLGALQIDSVKEISSNFYVFENYQYARAHSDIVGGHTPIMHDDIEVSATVEIVFRSFSLF